MSPSSRLRWPMVVPHQAWRLSRWRRAPWSSCPCRRTHTSRWPPYHLPALHCLGSLYRPTDEKGVDEQGEVSWWRIIHLFIYLFIHLCICFLGDIAELACSVINTKLLSKAALQFNKSFYMKINHSYATLHSYNTQIVNGQVEFFNPILTGGGGQFDPPCTKSATVSRPPQIATRLFMTFFFQVLRIFWYQICENRTIGREVTWRFVLTRRHKICPKSAFCICLCTRHMEITDYLKMH